MIWFSGSPAQWLLLLVLMKFGTQVTAWSLADDCTGEDAAKIREAMPNAIAMADYATKRAVQDPGPYPRKGNLLQDMLGASDENDSEALGLTRQWLGAARDVASANTAPGVGLVIHCSDKYLSLIDSSTGVYRDNTRGGVRVQTGYSPNACGGKLRAFQYSFGAGNVIVLCSDWAGGALSASVGNSIDSWRDRGNLAIDDLKGVGINFFERYLSYKLLHELMHCASGRQFPAELPDGRVGELYGYAKITGHAVGATGSGGPSAANRQHNADSFALLACGWYLPQYGYVNGQCKRVNERQRPPIDL
ncbi:MAG: hypothetical protein L6R40_003095 [Gallowayella cf. fulva]|nr:MAG: hypothetical protein L6R40_003095 [Xanthomendoza cf. fulva]